MCPGDIVSTRRFLGKPHRANPVTFVPRGNPKTQAEWPVWAKPIVADPPKGNALGFGHS